MKSLFENRRIRMLIDRLHHYKATLQYYDFTGLKKPAPCVIANSDNYVDMMGLADRMRNMLSLYLYCRERGYDFRISHNRPFRLEDILEPNHYDWRLKDNELSRSFWRVKKGEIYSYYKNLNKSKREEAEHQEIKLNEKVKSHRCQYHIFGNMHLYENLWAEAFRELFKPGKLLQQRLCELALPEKYDAVTLRFQQLLGDFKETYFKALPEKSQEDLISQCVHEIESLYNNGFFANATLLVTSDSERFLKEVVKLPYVRIIPGKMSHFSNSGENLDVYMKSFVDLYALANADSVTLLQTGSMYPSGFPEYASQIGGSEFKIHKF